MPCLYHIISNGTLALTGCAFTFGISHLVSLHLSLSNATMQRRPHYTVELRLLRRNFYMYENENKKKQFTYRFTELQKSDDCIGIENICQSEHVSGAPRPTCISATALSAPLPRGDRQ